MYRLLAFCYPELFAAISKVLLPSPTIYFCEASFSALTVMKIKYRAQMHVENDLRVCLSSIPPRIEKLCTERRPILLINTEQKTFDIDEKEGEGISGFSCRFPNRNMFYFFILTVIVFMCREIWKASPTNTTVITCRERLLTTCVEYFFFFFPLIFGLYIFI